MVQKLAFGKKKLRALYASYGEDDLFNSGKFNPLTRNLTTGALLSQTHHCERCEAKMAQVCYEALHYGFCSQWITRKDKRERCGERFAFRSQGCGKHPRYKGYNEAFYRAADGENVELCDFDYRHPLEADEEQIGQVDVKAEMAVIDALAEEYLKKHGYIPATFQNDQLNLWKKNNTYNPSPGFLVPRAPGEAGFDAPRGGSKVINGKTYQTFGKSIVNGTYEDNQGKLGFIARKKHMTFQDGADTLDNTVKQAMGKSFAPKPAKVKRNK